MAASDGQAFLTALAVQAEIDEPVARFPAELGPDIDMSMFIRRDRRRETARDR